MKSRSSQETKISAPRQRSKRGFPTRLCILADLVHRIIFNATVLNIVLPVVVDTWIVWNADKQVLQYDAVFKWWQWAVDEVITEAAPKIGATSANQAVGILTQELATSICATAAKYCTGPNTQYNSTADCHNFLTTGIRFGQAYELGKHSPNGAIEVQRQLC